VFDAMLDQVFTVSTVQLLPVLVIIKLRSLRLSSCSLHHFYWMPALCGRRI